MSLRCVKCKEFSPSLNEEFNMCRRCTRKTTLENERRTDGIVATQNALKQTLQKEQRQHKEEIVAEQNALKQTLQEKQRQHKEEIVAELKQHLQEEQGELTANLKRQIEAQEKKIMKTTETMITEKARIQSREFDVKLKELESKMQQQEQKHQQDIQKLKNEMETKRCDCEMEKAKQKRMSIEAQEETKRASLQVKEFEEKRKLLEKICGMRKSVPPKEYTQLVLSLTGATTENIESSFTLQGYGRENHPGDRQSIEPFTTH